MKRLIVIAGPTASGKTSLAIAIAKRLTTEILSADSKQFYKEMSIGTAKPTEEELAAVPHHFINSLSVTDNYSAGDYERDALTLLTQLFEQQDCVVLVGGSGLYIQAVINGFDDLPKASKAVRENLNQRLEKEGLASLAKELEAIDPKRAAQIALENPQRVIRSLEVYYETGKSYSSFTNTQNIDRNFIVDLYGIQWEREILYNRINERVEEMFAEGLVEEVKKLIPYKDTTALNTIGYNELFKYFNNEIDLAEAKRLIQRNSRRYAKRQLTYFKKFPITWLNPNELNEFIQQISC